MSAADDRVNVLFDLVQSNPEGVTVDDIMEHLDCSLKDANGAIHGLRMFLGETDEVFLTCHPQGSGERWLYQLSGGERTVDPESPEGRWIVNRVGDAETRIDTMVAAMHTAVRATSRGSLVGRKARVMEKALSRLREDLADMNASADGR